MPAGGSRFLLPSTRRCLLTGAGTGLGAAAGLAPALSKPFVARAFAQSKTLTMVQWSHFVRAFRQMFDQFAQDWSKKNGIAVTVDHIPVRTSLRARRRRHRPARDTICSCGGRYPDSRHRSRGNGPPGPCRPEIAGRSSRRRQPDRFGRGNDAISRPNLTAASSVGFPFLDDGARQNHVHVHAIL